MFRRVANEGPDWGFLANSGYLEGKVTLSGELIDLNMLLQLTTAVTNAAGDDAGNYVADTCASVSGNVVTMTGNTTHAADLFKWYILADTTDSKYYLITANSVSSASVITFTVTPTPPASIAGNTCDVFNPGTHTYATSTARASPSATPSFGMLYKMTHVDAAAANDLLKYFTGCVLDTVRIHGEPGESGGPITCDLDILFSNVTAGTALTTPGYPKHPNIKPYTFDRTSVTYQYGAGPTSYPGICTGFDIIYKDGKVLNKSANDLYASECLLMGREIAVDLKWAPKSKTHYDDTIHSPLDPAVASQVDVIIKMYRDSSLNYEQWDFQNVWALEAQDPDWSFRSMLSQNTTTFILKPSQYETGVLTITQSNHYKTNPYANGA